MPKIFVKPGIDKPSGKPFVIRDPQTLLILPAEGGEVELDTLTRRRLKDGDLVKAKAAKKSAPASEAKASSTRTEKG